MLTRVVIIWVFGLFCSNAMALGFGDVKGGDSKGMPFSTLGDNDVSGTAASGWYFKSANVSGGHGIKNAEVSSNEKSSYTFTTTGNNFNFVTFTVVLSGNITQHGPGGGPMPTYSLTGSRNGEFFITSVPESGVIPAGGTITFYGKEKFINISDPVGDKTCDWALEPASYDVNGTAYTPNPRYKVESTFLTVSPSSNHKTPDPGTYTVQAKASPSAENTWKSATLQVVEAKFEENASHSYGFDDYTNWSKNAADYYGPRTGKCTLPYASVRSGYVGTTQLTLTPSPVSANIDISSSTSNLLFSPSIRTSSGSITFNAESGWFSSSGSLYAKLNNTTLATLNVKAYRHKAFTVGVRLVHHTTWNSTAVNPGTIIETTFKQAGITFTVVPLGESRVNFDLNNDGMIDVASWMSAEMQAIRDNCDDPDVDFIIFVVSNPSDGSLGFMDFNQRYGFVHGGGGQVFAHELGHGQGLSHIFELDNAGNPINVPAKGIDQNNLMHPYADAVRVKLRKGQWDSLN